MKGNKQAKSYEALLRKRARRQARLVFKAMRVDIRKPIEIPPQPYWIREPDDRPWLEVANRKHAREQATAIASVALKRSR